MAYFLNFHNGVWQPSWILTKNGPDKVKRNAMIADYDKGGLKMQLVPSIINTKNIMWSKTFLSFNFHPWKEFLNICLNKIGLNSIMNSFDGKHHKTFGHFNF